MHFDVKFKDANGPLETVSHLRNGSVITSGVTVRDFGLGEILLGAITSRGNKATGGIYLRAECLPELIEGLMRLSADMRPQDREEIERRVGAVLDGWKIGEEDAAVLDRAFPTAPRT